MFDDNWTDKDGEDDFSGPGSDQFIRKLQNDIRQQVLGGAEKLIDWDEVSSQLDNQLETIIIPTEKIDYLQAVASHCAFDPDVTRCVCQKMSALSGDIDTIQEKITCASFVGYYSLDTDMRHAALDVLDDIVDPEGGFMTLLTLAAILNDDRPFDVESEERFEKHKSYFARLTRTIKENDPSLIVEMAYTVLQPLQCYNEFKPYLVEKIFENIEKCQNPGRALEAIFFCNRNMDSTIDTFSVEIDPETSEAPQEAAVSEMLDTRPANNYELFAMQVDPSFIHDADCNWESVFFISANRLMKIVGFDACVTVLGDGLQKDDYQSWMHEAYDVIRSMEIVFQLNRDEIKNITVVPEVVKAAPLDHKDYYIDLADDLYQKDIANLDKKAVQKECLESFRKAYEGLKVFGADACKGNDVDNNLAFSQLQIDILRTVLYGKDKLDQDESEQRYVGSSLLSCYAYNEHNIVILTTGQLNLEAHNKAYEYQRIKERCYLRPDESGPQAIDIYPHRFVVMNPRKPTDNFGVWIDSDNQPLEKMSLVPNPN